MKNIKRYYLEVGIVFLFIVFLMIVCVMLMKDINVGNNIIDSYILIKGMFLSVIMGSMTHSYSESKDGLKFELCFGLTRRKIFFDSCKRIIQVMTIALLLSVFYVWMCNYINNMNVNLFKIIYEEGILFLLEALLLSFLLGYFFGLLKIKSIIAFLIFIVLFVGLYFVIDIFKGNIFFDVCLFFVSLLIACLDYVLLEKVKIV